MWQSAQERPLPPRPWRRRSRKPMRPRATEMQLSPPHRSVEFAGRTIATASSSGSAPCTALAEKTDAIATKARQTLVADFMATLPNARINAALTYQDVLVRTFVPFRVAASLSPSFPIVAYG